MVDFVSRVLDVQDETMSADALVAREIGEEATDIPSTHVRIVIIEVSRF